MRRTLGELFLFGLVGVANTLVSYAVFALLLRARLHYAAATLLGGVAGLLLGFQLNGALVFGNRDHRRFPRFVAAFMTLYVLNVGLQKLLHSRVEPYLAGALATAICFPVSYGLNRGFVFRQDSTR
jgi:putative flippase GtrA